MDGSEPCWLVPAPSSQVPNDDGTCNLEQASLAANPKREKFNDYQPISSDRTNHGFLVSRDVPLPVCDFNLLFLLIIITFEL
jgi:hypothetical protein